MSGEFNKENMEVMCDRIIKALNVCMLNKELWKSDKYEMLKLIKVNDEFFYDNYPRLCRILVFSEDITPLLNMIKTFSRVQNGDLSFDEANKTITNSLNSTYVDDVLNSDKLKEERAKKIREKIQEIQ